MTGPANGSRYPLDFDALGKGSYIPPATVETILGISRESRTYSLALLDLVTEVDRQLEDRGFVVRVRCDQDGIRILTDEEAAEYNHKSLQGRMRGMWRDHRKNIAVDPANLSDGARANHERALEVDGKILQAMQAEAARQRIAHRKGPDQIEDDQS